MFGNESASGTIVRTVRKGVSEGGGGAWSKQERARDGGERERHWVIMSRHTASICVDELAVCRAYSCVTCCESECMRAVCAYCDLICALSASPLMFVWSCLSTASLIMSLAVRLMQQLIAALLAVDCHSAARAPQSFSIDPLCVLAVFAQ